MEKINIDDVFLNKRSKKEHGVIFKSEEGYVLKPFPYDLHKINSKFVTKKELIKKYEVINDK